MFREQLTSSSAKRALSVSCSATSSSDVNRRSFFLEATLTGEKDRHHQAGLGRPAAPPEEQGRGRALCKGRRLPSARAHTQATGEVLSHRPRGGRQGEARSRSKPRAASATRPAMRRPKERERGGNAEASGGAQGGKLQSKRVWQEASSRLLGEKPTTRPRAKSGQEKGLHRMEVRGGKRLENAHTLRG